MKRFFLLLISAIPFFFCISTTSARAAESSLQIEVMEELVDSSGFIAQPIEALAVDPLEAEVVAPPTPEAKSEEEAIVAPPDPEAIVAPPEPEPEVEVVAPPTPEAEAEVEVVAPPEPEAEAEVVAPPTPEAEAIVAPPEPEAEAETIVSPVVAPEDGFLPPGAFIADRKNEERASQSDPSVGSASIDEPPVSDGTFLSPRDFVAAKQEEVELANQEPTEVADSGAGETADTAYPAVLASTSGIEPSPDEYFEFQRPREVVEQIQQDNYNDYQVLSGVTDALERAIAEGSISVEEPVEPRKDGEKLVYKVELEDISFLCGDDDETPATVAKLKGQDELIVILWDSDFFEKAGYDSQTRCNQASTRFADFADEEELSITYMTSGKLNGQSVICLTNSKDGNCGEGIPLHEGLLFTLKPKENPDSKLRQLASLFKAEPAYESETPLKEEDKAPVDNETSNQNGGEPLKE